MQTQTCRADVDGDFNNDARLSRLCSVNPLLLTSSTVRCGNDGSVWTNCWKPSSPSLLPAEHHTSSLLTTSHLHLTSAICYTEYFKNMPRPQVPKPRPTPSCIRWDQRRVFYFFATQDIARILREVKDNFLAISRICLVAMAPCQR